MHQKFPHIWYILYRYELSWVCVCFCRIWDFLHLQVWNLENLLPIQALQRHEKAVLSMAVWQDTVFTGSEDMEIKVCPFSDRHCSMCPSTSPNRYYTQKHILILHFSFNFQVFKHFKLWFGDTCGQVWIFLFKLFLDIVRCVQLL